MKPRNLIVFGAPGTGKSYKLNEEVRQNFVDGEGNKRYERVTFYPTYSYAQFVGTYKPVMKSVKDAQGNPEYQQNEVNFRHYFIAMPKKQDAGVVITSGYEA